MSRHHHLDIYDAELHLAWKPKQWRADRKALSGDWLDAPTQALGCTTTSLNMKTYVFHVCLWIDVETLEDDPLRLLQIVAHEATHAAGRILDYAGQDYDGGSEALAHLVAWLTRWMLEVLPWSP